MSSRSRPLRSAFRLAIALIATVIGARPASTQDTREHWAFRALTRPAIPRASEAQRESPIDRFLNARLERAGIPARELADPYTLLRRVTFDLSGLPPSPEEIAAFLADPSREAYSRVVDRLLASPDFGERWGRRWLDVVRFAESSGGGRSLMFANAWRFRDYVLDAFHEDRPFDVFVSEQIAGDLMPATNDAQRNRQLIASGFLELGPNNYEQQDKELLRMDVIDEQIDTIGQAFLGLTLGCARCHDHKFDPVSAREYYSLAGIFGSTQVLTPGNVSGWNERELVGERTRSWHEWKAQRDKLRARLADMTPTPPRAPPRRPRVLDATKLAGIVLDDEDAQKTGAWIPSQHAPGYLGLGYLHDENTEKGQKSVRFTPHLPANSTYEVRISYTTGANRASNTVVHIDHLNGRKTLRVDQRVAPSGANGFHSLGRYRFTKGEGAAITISNEGTDGHVIVDALQVLRIRAGDKAAPRGPSADGAVRALASELAQLQKREPPRPLRAMAARDVAAPRDGHFHHRGLVRSKGARVPRGFLRACGVRGPAIPKGQSGRLQLAQWLTHPEHPLTARVYVNRVWHWLFGAGLVRSVDNFGTKGERPSHPELLDWLARRFVTQGWSTKRLVREIVHSDAYRRSIAAPHERDPENRLLASYPRRRLDAEALRDAILAISGQLDRTRGGKTIRKMAQYDYGYRFDSRRRSVYVPRFRSERLAFFDIFDAADPSMVTGARNVSNVAPQALYLSNSKWLWHHAARTIRSGAAALARPSALTELHLRVLGRPPRPRERAIARAFLGDEPDLDRWTAWAHALFGSLDFRYLQ